MVMEDTRETNAESGSVKMDSGLMGVSALLRRRESHPGGAEDGGGAVEGVASPGQSAPRLLGGRGATEWTV